LHAVVNEELVSYYFLFPFRIEQLHPPTKPPPWVVTPYALQKGAQSKLKMEEYVEITEQSPNYAVAMGATEKPRMEEKFASNWGQGQTMQPPRRMSKLCQEGWKVYPTWCNDRTQVVQQ
jgi:hypothetical protein